MAKRLREVILIDCGGTPSQGERDELFPAEIREILFQWLLKRLTKGIRDASSASLVFREISHIRSVEVNNRVLAHQALVPVLHNLYNAKASVAGLSIREANRILDLVALQPSVESAWSIYSLITYYEEKARHTMEKFSPHRSPLGHFKDRDVIACHFCVGPKGVTPFAEIGGLYLVEGMEERSDDYRRQRERYIESFSDDDTKARLRQLLVKSSYDESRGFFLEQLLSLHDPDTPAENVREHLTRKKAFPVTLTRLHSITSDDSKKKVTALAFRLPDSSDYRLFLTSRHSEVMKVKESMFRIRGTSLEEAKQAHRLYKFTGEMKRRAESLVESMPTLIEIV
jgi:hypothetical protein